MEKSNLKIVYGGLADSCRLGNVLCRLSTGQASPPEPQAVIYEEDTHLILTVDKVIRYTEVNPLRVMTDLLYARPHKPGSLITKGKNWYAVVVDVDSRHLCSPEWIALAYANIDRKIRQEGISVIATHLLGTIHGRLSLHEGFSLLAEAVQTWQPGTLKEVRLIVSEPSRTAVRKEFRAHAGS